MHQWIRLLLSCQRLFYNKKGVLFLLQSDGENRKSILVFSCSGSSIRRISIGIPCERNMEMFMYLIRLDCKIHLGNWVKWIQGTLVSAGFVIFPDMKRQAIGPWFRQRAIRQQCPQSSLLVCPTMPKQHPCHFLTTFWIPLCILQVNRNTRSRPSMWCIKNMCCYWRLSSWWCQLLCKLSSSSIHWRLTSWHNLQQPLFCDFLLFIRCIMKFNACIILIPVYKQCSKK